MAGGGAGVERGLWIVRQRRALLVSPAPELRPPAETSSRRSGSGSAVRGSHRTRTIRCGFFGFVSFQGFAGRKIFLPGNPAIFRPERKPPGSTKVAGPSRQASDFFSVSFLINGLQGGKFPCHRIRRRFGAEGEPPLREDVAAAERHLPQPVQRLETALPDHAACAQPIASPSRAICNRAKPVGQHRSAGASRDSRVRRMRDPELNVRSPPDPQPPPRGRWRRSWTARKFRGRRGRNLGVRFLRGDGHDVSE